MATLLCYIAVGLLELLYEHCRVTATLPLRRQAWLLLAWPLEWLVTSVRPWNPAFRDRFFRLSLGTPEGAPTPCERCLAPLCDCGECHACTAWGSDFDDDDFDDLRAA